MNPEDASEIEPLSGKPILAEQISSPVNEQSEVAAIQSNAQGGEVDPA